MKKSYAAKIISVLVVMLLLLVFPATAFACDFDDKCSEKDCDHEKGSYGKDSYGLCYKAINVKIVWLDKNGASLKTGLPTKKVDVSVVGTKVGCKDLTLKGATTLKSPWTGSVKLYYYKSGGKAYWWPLCTDGVYTLTAPDFNGFTKTITQTVSGKDLVFTVTYKSNSGDDCKCGGKGGKDCTCGKDCDCGGNGGKDCDCGGKGGKDCDCGGNGCNCGDGGKDCNCNGNGGKDCNCGGDDCNCGNSGDCDCGGNGGADCTCGNDCNCGGGNSGDDCNCGGNGGADCTCGDDCNCGGGDGPEVPGSGF